jgi:hypothetical protein
VTLYASLFDGLNVGLKSDTLTKYAAGATLLADFDFDTPVTSYDFSHASMTDYWDMQTYSSGYTNGAGSEKLVNDTGLTGQTCVGIWNGSSFTARKAWESGSTAANSDTLVSDGTTAGDVNAQDFCIRFVFRHAGVPGNADAWFTKYTGAAGWGIYRTANSVRFFVRESGVGIVELSTADTGNAFAGGGLHYITAWYDHSAETIYMKSDKFSEVSTSTAALSGDFSTSAAVQVNGWGGASATNGHPQMQAYFAGICVGSNAQTVYDDMDTAWAHATDPTGLLTTTNRNCLISTQVADGYVAHWSGSTTTPQLPIAYDSNFTAGNKLGLYVNSAVTNIAPYSEILTTGWAASNASLADNQGDSPDGFRTAGTVTATANNGFGYDAIGSIANSTEYTFSIWIKRNGGSDVSGKIRLHDSASGTGTDQAFTATSTWQRIQVSHTSDAAATSSQIRVYVDNNTESVFVWGAQLELGDGATAYLRTSGASASAVYSNYKTVGAAGQYAKAETGEIEAVFSFPNTSGVPTNRRVICVSKSSASNQNQRDIFGDGSNLAFYVRDSSGAVTANPGHTGGWAVNTELTQLCRWNANGELALGGGQEASTLLNGADEQSNIGTFSYAEDITLVQIGNYQNAGSTFAMDGILQRARIWDQEGGAE